METNPKQKNIIVLNNVRSALNVGNIFRLADSLNYNLLIQGITPYPITKNDKRLPFIAKSAHKKIAKSATESIKNVKFLYKNSEKEVINYLNKHKYNIYSLENNVDGCVSFYTQKVSKPFAIIVGNEVQGVNKSLLKASSKVFYLPMYGKNKSINVTNSLSAFLYLADYKLTK